MNEEERQYLLDSFLSRWPIDRVEAMQLSEFVDVGNPDTFCQWIETKTRPLGSIKGGSSYKFGLFKWKDESKKGKPGPYDDGEYRWAKRFGSDRNEAFQNIKREILEVVRYAMSGDFESIDRVSISDMFKWKIAFLYSNQRLIPIYEPETLADIGSYYGIDEWHSGVSNIQRVMMENKPVDKTVYEWMDELWSRFHDGGLEPNQPSNEEVSVANRNFVGLRNRRRPATSLNLESQIRNTSQTSVVAMKHNLLQKTLHDQLIEEFGADCVFLEEDYVDIKLVVDDCITLFEVKSDSYASGCIREAIGQLLFYALSLNDPRETKLVVVGQYPPNGMEKELLDRLSQTISFDLTYRSVDLA